MKVTNCKYQDANCTLSWAVRSAITIGFAKTWARSELLFPKVLVFRSSNLYQDMIEQGRIEDARPKRKPLIKLPSFGKKPEEKDFERRGRNIFKFRRSVRFSK